MHRILLHRGMLRIFLLLLSSLCLIAKDKPKHKMALADQLVAHWKMEQNPALFKVWDYSGNGNHLTGVSSPILVDGKLGKAIQFDGVDQYLSIASNAGINHNGGEVTGLMWFQPVSLVHGKRLIGSVDWGVSIVDSGGNFYVNVAIEDGSFNITDVPLEVGEWYFLAFGWYGIENAATRGTYSWGSVNLSARVREFRAVWSDPSGPFTIAGTSGGSRANVIIDDTALFHRFVTAQETRTIFNNGNGLAFDEWGIVTPCRTIDCCD